MKTQLNQRLQTIALATTAAVFLLGALRPAFAQKKGPITEKEVKAYFTDWWTHDCEKSDDCRVTFDSPIRIAPAVQHTFQIPPTTYLTYPVKVNFTTHRNGGTFQITHYTHAVYYFYRDSFGDWEMGKEDERTTQEKDGQQPTQQNNPPKKAEPDAETQTDDNAKEEKDFPKPDFSAMEQWFDIVRYEYPAPPERDMTIFIKPKVDLDKRATVFKMEFRDKDGVIVGVDPAWLCCSTQLGYTETGKVGKVTVPVPSEREMDKIVSATIVRIKE